MTAFADWLGRLLEAGESVQPGPPDISSAARTAAGPLLREAFRRHALDVAGPAVPFDPEAPPGFGHPGLDLLYAERLADRPHPAWVPPPGPARDQVERVFARLGKPVPVPATVPTEAPA